MENNQTPISQSNGPSPMSEVYGGSSNLHENQNSSHLKPKKHSPFPKYVLAIWEIIKILIIAVIIVLPIRYFIFQPFIVKGDSMVPNFHSGDYLIVDELSYRFIDPSRGDVAVLKYPLDENQRFIKRIIGLPGETIDIKNNVVTITTPDKKTLILNEASYLPGADITEGNVHVTLKEDEYFVMGDNRPFSYDSRRWGVLPKEDIIGRASLRIFPLSNFSFLSEPTY